MAYAGFICDLANKAWAKRLLDLLARERSRVGSC